jgi:SHS2 domain-containing protein
MIQQKEIQREAILLIEKNERDSKRKIKAIQRETNEQIEALKEERREIKIRQKREARRLIKAIEEDLYQTITKQQIESEQQIELIQKETILKIKAIEEREKINKKEIQQESIIYANSASKLLFDNEFKREIAVCCVCLNENQLFSSYNCSHCICAECYSNINKTSDNKCPQCRSSIKSITFLLSIKKYKYI